MVRDCGTISAPAQDIYSFGMIMYEMLGTLCPPARAAYVSRSDVMSNVERLPPFHYDAPLLRVAASIALENKCVAWRTPDLCRSPS
jgi:hypothetical protein